MTLLSPSPTPPPVPPPAGETRLERRQREQRERRDQRRALADRRAEARRRARTARLAAALGDAIRPRRFTMRVRRFPGRWPLRITLSGPGQAYADLVAVEVETAPHRSPEPLARGPRVGASATSSPKPATAKCSLAIGPPMRDMWKRSRVTRRGPFDAMSGRSSPTYSPKQQVANGHSTVSGHHLGRERPRRDR